MLIKDLISAAAGRSTEAVPLFWWQGWSSRWYVTTVHSLEGFSCREPAMFVVARKEADGTRTPLLVGAAEDVSDALYNECGDALLRAIKAGAREIHLHFAAPDGEEREAAAGDVAAGWRMEAHRPPVHA